jgi:UDP:flavonoid glycosyltransferase YjiC (YdhE family)
MPPEATEASAMSGSDGREIYRVVWPRGAKTVEATDVAPRLDTLEGKTIGQLWDDLFRGDEIFPILEEEIARRFPGVRFVRYDTFGSTHGKDEQRVLAELPARLRDLGVDAVISGMAC